MRTRLLLLTAVTVILAALAGRQSAHAGAAACTATASGHHAREQLLAVHLSAGCPTTGTATGALNFSQYPGHPRQDELHHRLRRRDDRDSDAGHAFDRAGLDGPQRDAPRSR